MSLFQKGSFVSAAGLELPFKIECDALTKDDWDCLADIVLHRFIVKKVYSVPTGGDQFSEAIKKKKKKYDNGIILIVDDVLTTGLSIIEARAKIEHDHKNEGIYGVVVFSRGKCPSWVTPIYQMHESWK